MDAMMQTPECEEIRIAVMMMTDGESAPLDASQIEAHLQCCGSCRRAIEWLDVGSLFPEQAKRAAQSGGLWPAIQQRLEDEIKKNGRGSKAKSLKSTWALAAVALSVCLLVGLGVWALSGVIGRNDPSQGMSAKRAQSAATDNVDQATDALRDGRKEPSPAAEPDEVSRPRPAAIGREQHLETPLASASEAQLELWRLLRLSDVVVVGRASNKGGMLTIQARESLKGDAVGAIQLTVIPPGASPQGSLTSQPFKDGSDGIFFLQLKNGRYHQFSSQCFKALDQRRRLDRLIAMEKDPGPFLKADVDSVESVNLLLDLFLPSRERDERELRLEPVTVLPPKARVGSVSLEQAVGYLRRRLKSQDPDVVRASLRALGELKAGQAVPDVIAIFESTTLVADDQGLYTKLVAAKCLGQLGDNRATDALGKTLDAFDPNRKDEFTYRSLMESCTYALESTAGANAVPVLKRVYDRGLTIAALHLARQGDESCFEYLLLNLERGEYADPYFHALRTDLKIEPWMSQVIVRKEERPALGKSWREWYERHKAEFKYVRSWEEVQDRLYKEELRQRRKRARGATINAIEGAAFSLSARI